MAELRYVEGNIASAVSFWAECRDLLLVVYFDGGSRSAPPHAPLKLLLRIERLLTRVVRFLFALGTDTINKNLALIDALLNVQACLCRVFLLLCACRNIVINSLLANAD